LTTTGNFVPPIQARAFILTEIQAQINTGKLIGVRIEWPGGDGHFVIVHGFDDTTADPLVYIGDPIYGKSIIKLSTFTNDYHQAGGQWTHSYITKSQVSVLQFTDINAHLFEAARRVRPEAAKSRQEKINFSTPPDIALSMPHDVYLIDINSLRLQAVPTFRLIGFRVLDNSEKNHQLIYEFDNSTANGTVQQVIHDPSYTLPYFEALDNMMKNPYLQNGQFSLRLVRLPSLKVEALWLHEDKDPHLDHFLPLSPTSVFPTREPLPAAVFFDRLRQAAEEKRNYNDPLLGG
jgi:hypothetical protein